jgi:DNA invertase Pin-like site-specific DNA recombinase
MVVAAVGYIRTSSNTNVGVDKDSGQRQRIAIDMCAKAMGYTIPEDGYFSDEHVKGETPLVLRKEFTRMLQYCDKHSIKVIIFEETGRFSRSLVVQELSHTELTSAGFTLVSAASPCSFVSQTPEAVFLRQMLGAAAEYQKNVVVQRLDGARKRAAETKCKKSLVTGKPKTQGMKSSLEGEHKDAIAHTIKPYLHQETLTRDDCRGISAHLASLGVVTRSGKNIGRSCINQWHKALKDVDQSEAQ